MPNICSSALVIDQFIESMVDTGVWTANNMVDIAVMRDFPFRKAGGFPL
jgi:hypothetical protein